MSQPYLSQQERDENRARIRAKERQRLVQELGSDATRRILREHAERMEYRLSDGSRSLVQSVEEEIHDCGNQIEAILERLWNNEQLLGDEVLFHQDDTSMCREAQLLAVLQNAYECLEEALDILMEHRPSMLGKSRVYAVWEDHAEFEDAETDPDDFDELHEIEIPLPDAEGVRTSFFPGRGRPPKDHPVSIANEVARRGEALDRAAGDFHKPKRGRPTRR